MKAFFNHIYTEGGFFFMQNKQIHRLFSVENERFIHFQH